MTPEEGSMIGLLITILVAALAYLLLVAITGSSIVGIVAAILILVAGIPTGGFGFGGRFGGRGTRAAP
jgi:Na+/proline symporter